MIAVANSVALAIVFDPLLPLLIKLSSGFFVLHSHVASAFVLDYPAFNGAEWSVKRSKYLDG